MSRRPATYSPVSDVSTPRNAPMKRALRHNLSLFVAAALAAAPFSALAAPDTPAPLASCPTPETLTAQDREVLAAAEQLALEAAGQLEQWITAKEVTQEQLFARFYFPVPNTNPRQFSTVYDKLADRDLVPIQDKVLAASPARQYAIVTDFNGYVPAHNTRYSRPLTGDPEKDYEGNRTKRLLHDVEAVHAARSTARYLLQPARGDNGEPLSDLSVPLMVRGKHWGTVRIGYRRAE
jgi:hypothetical protein